MNNRKGKGYPADSRTISARIVLIYAAIGGMWILFSDRLLKALVEDPAALTRLQTAKGWLYVAATALLLYWLINRYLSEISRAAIERWKSEDKFQAIFHSAPVSIWEVDLSAVKEDLDNLAALGVRDFTLYFDEQPDFVLNALRKTKVLDVNEATIRMFAAKEKAILLGVLDKAFLPESLRAFREGVIAVAEERERFESEATILTLEGERRNILVTLAIPSDRAKFDNLPVSVVDITERKRTEEMLRLLESAVQQTSEAVTITTAELDPPGPQIVFVNPAFTGITGYTAEEVIGRTPRILHGPKTEHTVLGRMRQALYQRQTFHAETVNYRKDGTDFIMEWFVAPIVNEKFQVTHFVAVQRDVTERRRAEEEIRKSEALLRVVFDQAFQLMGLLTPDGTLIKINRTAFDFIHGRESEVLGKPFWETPWWTHSPELQERLRDAVKKAAAGEFVRFEATHPTPEGDLVHVDFSLKPVKDEEGNVVLLVPEGRDVTERKRAEEEIRKLNEELRRRVAELEVEKR